ncbi:hypothetical protein Tco_1193793 [Tanacetum coccineum]
MPKRMFDKLASHLQDVMFEALPKMVDDHIKEQVTRQVLEQLKRENLRAEISSQIQNAIANHIPSQVDASVPDTSCRPSAISPRDQDDPHDDAHPEGENSAKRQKTYEYEAYVSRESSSGQVNKSNQGPSSLGNQELVDDYDFWIDSYASDDDEIPIKQVSQELMDEFMQSVDEAKLRKVADEIKEILVLPHPPKPTPVVQSCQRDPKSPVMTLMNHDLLYLKKRSTGPEKIMLSLHKFPANNHAKIFYIRKQKELGKPKEEIYSNSKIIEIIKTYWELGHEHKFVTEIIAKRDNESIVSITESDYKNLNKNDIKDMYMLVVNHKLGVESYQHKVNLTAPTITFPDTEKHKMFSIVSEPVYGIIYKNSKKEKRVMRHSEIHKFCDATLKRVLASLKSYNNDVCWDS